MTVLILTSLRHLTGNTLLTDLCYYTMISLTRYFLPSHNPDGYAYTRDHNRMWRKTRSDNGGILGCKVGLLSLLSEIMLIQCRVLMQTGTMVITGMREDLPMTSKLRENHIMFDSMFLFVLFQMQ